MGRCQWTMYIRLASRVCDLSITMSTEITPYQHSIALQYIGIRFCQFSRAVQQSARWSTQPPPNWFQQVRVEVVGGIYIYKVTFNHRIACIGTNPCHIQFHRDHHASATYGKQDSVICDILKHHGRSAVFGIEGYQCIQGLVSQGSNLEYWHHAECVVGRWQDPPRPVCLMVNCGYSFRGREIPPHSGGKSKQRILCQY